MMEDYFAVHVMVWVNFMLQKDISVLIVSNNNKSLS